MATTYWPHTSDPYIQAQWFFVTYPGAGGDPDSSAIGTWPGYAHPLLAMRGAQSLQLSNNTIAGIASGFVTEAGESSGSDPKVIFMTNPLKAVTIAGTINYNLRALETSAKGNYGIGLRIVRCSNSGAWISRIARGSNATELGTVEAVRSGTLTPTSTALAMGDRLGLIVEWYAVGGTTASGFGASFWHGGPTSGGSGDSFITFAEDITEIDLPDRGSVTRGAQHLAHRYQPTIYAPPS